MSNASGGNPLFELGLRLPQKELFDADSVLETESALQELLHDASLKLVASSDPSTYYARLTGHVLDWAQFYGVEVTERVVAEAVPGPWYDIVVVCSGAIDYECADGWRKLRPGDAFMGSGKSTYRLAWNRNTEGLVIRLRAESLVRIVEELEGSAVVPVVRFEPHVNLMDPAFRSWLLSLSALFADLDSTASLLRRGVTASAWAQLLWKPLLFNQPNSRTEYLRHVKPDHPPIYVKRVVDYVHAHLQEDISRATLTDVSGAAERTLHKWFKRHYGVGPMTYVRNLKLLRVREILLAARPDTHNVGDIAARWGFIDPSRFAAMYRTMFGELPSATLQRDGSVARNERQRQ